jgi:hypothetical protein
LMKLTTVGIKKSRCEFVLTMIVITEFIAILENMT